MKYRPLGRTGLSVSEIGFGGEWLEKHDESEAADVVRYAGEQGINIIDCWMADPKSREIIGKAMEGNREKWIVQGHIGATWQDGQYVRTREPEKIIPAFEDLLCRMRTDYIDLGMIHFVDTVSDWETCIGTGYLQYVKDLHDRGVIRHIGLSTHNPEIGVKAVRSGIVEMLLFSINPAFDMRPPTDEVNDLFEGYEAGFSGIDPARAALYRLCETEEIGITVMKGFFGGRLLDAAKSPFGVAFTPSQCIHYALTRPGVSSVLCGFETIGQVDAALRYEEASDDEKDYASVIAGAPMHSYSGMCTYCGHCAPCPMDIDIAMVNKYYDLAEQYESVPASVREHYGSLGSTASACVGCRQCEERCPFDVKVADRMAKTAELFGL